MPLTGLSAEFVRVVEGSNAPALRVGGDCSLRVVPVRSILIDLLLYVADCYDSATVIVLIPLLLHLAIVGQLPFVRVEIHGFASDGSLLLNQLWLRRLSFCAVKRRLQQSGLVRMRLVGNCLDALLLLRLAHGLRQHRLLLGLGHFGALTLLNRS